MTNKSFKTIISGILLVFGIAMIMFMHQLGELIEVGENLDGKIVYSFNIGFRGICILGTIGAVLVGVTGSILLKKRHIFMVLGLVAALLDLGMISYIRYSSKTRVMLGDNVDDKTAAWDRFEAIHSVGTAFVVILIIVTLALFVLEYLRYVKISWKFERVFGSVLFSVVALDLCFKAFTNFWYIGFVVVSVGLAGFAVLYDMKKSKQKKFIFYLAAAMIAGGMLVLVTDSVVNKVTSSKNETKAVRAEALQAYDRALTEPYFDWIDGEMYSTEDMRFAVIDINGKKGVPALVLENNHSAAAYGTNKLFIYKDGKVVELWPSGGNCNCIYANSYSETGIFECSGGRRSLLFGYCFEIQEDNSLKLRGDVFYNLETDEMIYSWDGKEVSEDKYNSYYEKFVKGEKLKDIEWLENTEENREKVFK